MKKVMISFLAIAAISNVAFAERSYDLRESDTYFGKYAQPSTIERLKPVDETGEIRAWAVNPDETSDKTRKEIREMRRLDEKNDGPTN